MKCRWDLRNRVFPQIFDFGKDRDVTQAICLTRGVDMLSAQKLAGYKPARQVRQDA